MCEELENEIDEDNLYDDADYSHHRACCATAEDWMRAIEIHPESNFVIDIINKERERGDNYMRLWHKDLIKILPKQQLLGQWRECCAIAKSISEKGTPNHILVNRIMEYPMRHFYTYGMLVHRIMKLRGYKCDFDKFGHYFTYPHETEEIDHNKLFQNWHNERYFLQCYYNLEEKYDCGGITEDEWKKIKSEMNPRLFW